MILLNEVDLGTKRSGYADIPRELADTLGMDYAFGVEFVEVGRLYTGEEHIEMATPEETQALAEELRVDPAHYQGLHGNATLTRFPLPSVCIERLPQCYDWYKSHRQARAGEALGREEGICRTRGLPGAPRWTHVADR